MCCELAVRRSLGRTSRSRRGEQLFGTIIALPKYGTSPATPTVLSMTATRPSGWVFGITCNTLVRSSQRPYMGRHGGAPTAAGWGEDCWTGSPISPPPGSALLRYDLITQMQTSHAPPPEPNRARIVWRNRIGAVVDTDNTRLTLTI